MIALDEVAARLARNAEVIRRLADCPDEHARWKPEPKRWSLLEVLGHLLDEEREDFRQRIDILLHRPDAPWPPIDPEGWVVQRAYNAADPADALAAFLAERRASLAWLAGLRAPDWDRSRTHPSAGVLRAGDLLAAWQRHDLLHIRQMVALHAEREKAAAAPFRTDYAGS